MQHGGGNGVRRAYGVPDMEAACLLARQGVFLETEIRQQDFLLRRSSLGRAGGAKVGTARSIPAVGSGARRAERWRQNKRGEQTHAASACTSTPAPRQVPSAVQESGLANRCGGTGSSGGNPPLQQLQPAASLTSSKLFFSGFCRPLL